MFLNGWMEIARDMGRIHDVLGSQHNNNVRHLNN